MSFQRRSRVWCSRAWTGWRRSTDWPCRQLPSSASVARGRALAGVLQGRADVAVRPELMRVRAALVDAGLKAFLPGIESALAA
jgi:hypothetical protein